MQNENFKDDEQAILRLTAGDLSAFRYLFARHFTDLCNFLNIYLHSREFSEAIALELFEFIWENRETLVFRVSFKSFLFSSARNRAISHFRKEHRKVFTTLEYSESTLPDESASQNFMEQKELRSILESAILKLPEQSRKIFLMAREEGLSHKEIAVKLGITSKTVENHVGIALRKLRESLRPYYRQIFMAWILPVLLY